VDKRRIFILGAADPEMEVIEALLKGEGEVVIYATVGGRRVSPGEAYKADIPSSEEYEHIRRFGGEIFLVECEPRDPRLGLQSISEVDCAAVVDVIDHHRPGDPGYGRSPSEYWGASSLGQVWAALGWGEEKPSSELLMTAAADHCLAAAYRGECPGVNPEDLMRWRAFSRAKFQRRTVQEVLADVERARDLLRSAPRVELWAGISVADLRGKEIPELPEAAAREGIAFLATPRPGPDKRAKVVLQAASSEQVRLFLEKWAPQNGLKDIYGDPNRGFAGGYL
jgi:hypothetical protein